jgi:hypothetical protein
MTGRRPVENWHDMIGNHTFGDTVLERLYYYSHWLILTGGSLRGLRTSEYPTDCPPSSASLPG